MLVLTASEDEDKCGCRGGERQEDDDTEPGVAPFRDGAMLRCHDHPEDDGARTR